MQYVLVAFSVFCVIVLISFFEYYVRILFIVSLDYFSSVAHEFGLKLDYFIAY